MTSNARIRGNPPTTIDAVVLSSLVREFREGRNPRLPQALEHPFLQAIGRPLTAAGTKDLMVKSALVNGRNTRHAGDLVKAADDNIARQASRPNLKQAAAAVARASRKPRAVASAGA